MFGILEYFVGRKIYLGMYKEVGELPNKTWGEGYRSQSAIIKYEMHFIFVILPLVSFLYQNMVSTQKKSENFSFGFDPVIPSIVSSLSTLMKVWLLL